MNKQMNLNQFSFQVFPIDSLQLPAIDSQEKSLVLKEFDLRKDKVLRYRIIFLLFGVLFTFLAAFLFFKTANWNFSLLFGQNHYPKQFFAFFTLALAFASLWIGCCMRTEHEIVKHYAKDFNRRLKGLPQSDRLKAKANAAIEIDHLCRKADLDIDGINHTHRLTESAKLQKKIDRLTFLKKDLEMVLLSVNKNINA